MSSQNYPDEFEELDFDVVEEYWNEYELGDSSARLRARTILRKIIADPHNLNNYAFDFAPVILVVFAPLSSRGEKNNQPKEHEYDKLPSYEVAINNANERYNKYRILKNDVVVKARLIVSEVSRIKDRFDANGLPFYIATYSHDIPNVRPKSQNKLLP